MNRSDMRCLLFVTLFLPLLPARCLFDGESCVANKKTGHCILLSECQPILSEIKRAGTPMPSHIRRRLQEITCGFEFDEPMVCCVTSHVNDENTDIDSQYWPPATHGMGVSVDNPRPNVGIINSWTTGGNKESTQSPFITETIRKPTSTTGFIDSNDDGNNRNDSPNNSNGDGPPDVRRHRNLRLLPTSCGPIESDRIYGGNRTRLYEMPWMVLIAYDDSARGTKLSCGGTLITERYVLTAAHCVSFLGTRLKLSGVVLGEYDVRSDPDCERVEGELSCAPNVRNVTIDSVIPHPGYSPQNLFDDIALIRLAQPADFTLDNMKPICLPSTPELQTEVLDGVQGVVAGWGATEDGLQSPVLLSVDLPIVSNKDCQEDYNGNPHIYDRQMCAGGVEDKDSCGGDSGGPLMYPGRVGTGGIRYVQRGIVSYGSKRCGIGGFPGVYTRVAYYMDWILDNIRN